MKLKKDLKSLWPRTSHYKQTAEQLIRKLHSVIIEIMDSKTSKAQSNQRRSGLFYVLKQNNFLKTLDKGTIPYTSSRFSSCCYRRLELKTNADHTALTPTINSVAVSTTANLSTPPTRGKKSWYSFVLRCICMVCRIFVTTWLW